MLPFKRDESCRAIRPTKLDVCYGKYYGLTSEKLCKILDPKDIFGPNFSRESFHFLKEKEEREYGEYCTRRLILEAWDKIDESRKYETG